MSRTSSFLSWGIGLACVILVTVILLIVGLLIGQAIERYRALEDHYASLGVTTQALYNKILELTQSPSLEEVPLPDKPIIVDAQSPPAMSLLGVLLLLVWILNLVTIFSLLVIAARQRQRLAFEFERQTRKAQETGHAEGVRAVAQGLIEDEDILAEVIEWLQKYRQGKARLDDAAHVHSRVLKKLIEQASLIPIGEPGRVVTFDPRVHRTFDKMKPGEEAVVVETGWRVAHDIIKRPVVRRKL